MEQRKIVKYDKMTGRPIYEDELQMAQNMQSTRKIVRYDAMTGQPIYEDELQMPPYSEEPYQQIPYGQQPYEQSAYGQQSYQQAAYGQPPYQQPVNMAGAAQMAGVFSSAAGTAQKVAVKSMSAGKKLGILGAIAAFIIAGLSAYFTFFVGTPADTVESFFSAANDLDYEGMIDCLDPSSQAAMETAMGIGSSLVSGITGFDIDLKSMAALGAFIPEEYVGAAIEYSNVRTVSITGDKLSGFVSQFGTKIQGIGNALGSEARVQFDVPNTEKYQNFGTGYVPCSNSKITYEITIKKYGSDGWCITITDPIVFVGGTD